MAATLFNLPKGVIPAGTYQITDRKVPEALINARFVITENVLPGTNSDVIVEVNLTFTDTADNDQQTIAVKLNGGTYRTPSGFGIPAMSVQGTLRVSGTIKVNQPINSGITLEIP